MESLKFMDHINPKILKYLSTLPVVKWKTLSPGNPLGPIDSILDTLMSNSIRKVLPHFSYVFMIWPLLLSLQGATKIEILYDLFMSQFLIGVIHKPRGQLRGRGCSQMTILSHKPYLVKVTTKGGRGSKISKNLTTWFTDDPLYHQGAL